MIQIDHLATILCDFNLDSDYCWGEIVIGFNPEEGESMTDVLIFLKNMGWEFDSEDPESLKQVICICPFCGKGVKQKKEKGMKRIK